MRRVGAERSAPWDTGGAVVAVLPALDEELALPAVLAAIPRCLVRQVIVVDNGSRDATAQVAQDGGAHVLHEPRRGYGAACLRALRYLEDDPPQVVVFLDADGSDVPSELERVVAPIVAGEADLVVGSRTPKDALTPVQRFGNRLAALLLRVGYGVRYTDLGPFRAIRWSALQRLRMRDRGYGWTVEMQARAARAGLRAAEVPVSCRRRAAGRSKVSGTLRGVIGAGGKILLTLVRVRWGG